MKKIKKHYVIREGSPVDMIIRALPFIGIIALIIGTGLMNSWELGLL